MRPALALAAFSALVLAPATSAEGAGADRPRVALSVSPTRVAVAGTASRRLTLRNDGAEAVIVDVTSGAKPWLRIVPAHVSLRSGGRTFLTLRITPPGRTEPGDHRTDVLLTTRPPSGGRVNVQVRLGVRVDMLVPGRIVRRLTLGALRVHRQRGGRFMLVSVVNHGNVTVQLRGRVTASLVRRDRQLARLRPRVRLALRPGSRTVLTLRYGGRVRGLVTAVVRARLGPGIRVVERRYRVRL